MDFSEFLSFISQKCEATRPLAVVMGRGEQQKAVPRTWRTSSPPPARQRSPNRFLSATAPSCPIFATYCWSFALDQATKFLPPRRSPLIRPFWISSSPWCPAPACWSCRGGSNSVPVFSSPLHLSPTKLRCSSARRACSPRFSPANGRCRRA